MCSGSEDLWRGRGGSGGRNQVQEDDSKQGVDNLIMNQSVSAGYKDDKRSQ